MQFPVIFLTFWLTNVLLATLACNFSASELPKVARTWCVLHILTWKCASRHDGVQFFDIWIQKWPLTWCVLHILTWKCASGHDGVQFFDIWTSKSGPNMVCFSPFWLENALLATAACNFSFLLWPRDSAPVVSRRSFSESQWPPIPLLGEQSSGGIAEQCLRAKSCWFACLFLLVVDDFPSFVLELTSVFGEWPKIEHPALLLMSESLRQTMGIGTVSYDSLVFYVAGGAGFQLVTLSDCFPQMH